MINKAFPLQHFNIQRLTFRMGMGHLAMGVPGGAGGPLEVAEGPPADLPVGRCHSDKASLHCASSCVAPCGTSE